ncbi:hypothetical protein [Lysobacter capsici]|uniref:hypothetical protein n=1 Tax=Lysobacter capsici TaxID=435897 RepID=UPI000AE3247B|nr:hypothetical protein [Lysobacter capsici]
MADPLKLESTDLEALLAPYIRGDDPRYHSARWLESNYYDDTWKINSDTRFEINWNIQLFNGTTLTCSANTKLLEAFRSWIVARMHVDTTGGRLYAARSERNLIQDTLHCIDYLLLRAESLKLVQGGLSSLSINDLRSMLACIASNRSVIQSIYEWPERLSGFLRDRIAELPKEALQRAKSIHHDIESSFPDVSDRLTNLNSQEILLARSWLTLNDIYGHGINGYRLSPRLSTVAKSLYQRTIFGSLLVLPVPTELCLGPSYFVRTEYPRARVKSRRDERMSSSLISRFVTSISTLTLLSSVGIDAPRFRPDDLRQFATSLDTKQAGRFRTLPQQVVFQALRSAIEFVLSHGHPLVESYLGLAGKAKAAGVPVGVFAEQTKEITAYLSEDCRRLGVCKWTIETTGAANSPVLQELDGAQWFSALRSNAGLYECLLVLFGAVQLVVGTLTARRSGELLDLTAHSCLDGSETHLLFRNRKSGPAELRELEARPVPPIAVRFIKLLEKLQSGLIEIGALDSPTKLFAPPTKYKSSYLAKVNRTQHFRLLDIFCDWSESPLDEEGNRYYIRQHQLRRFFAMLFFWGGGFGGMDTLRWFLGHTDVKHLWHYITESVPGITIRTIAAEWAAYGVKHATKEAEMLGAEISQHFGTTDFQVLDEEALILHIEDLLEEGRLRIEPQFLDGGDSYRIAVVLTPRDSL